MPELPEVETIRRDLEVHVLQREIKKIDILLPKICKNSNLFFQKNLLNNSFTKISRRGKLLIFELKNCSNFLTIHLRMTGQLIFQDKDYVIAGGHSEKKTDL